MDMHDKHLDSWISAALQPGTGVSTHQRQRVWEEVSRRAARQTMLPGRVMDEQKASFLGWLASTGRCLCKQITSFAVDEAQYERARQNRHVMRYGGPSREGRLAFHAFNPLGFSCLSPAF